MIHVCRDCRTAKRGAVMSTDGEVKVCAACGSGRVEEVGL